MNMDKGIDIILKHIKRNQRQIIIYLVIILGILLLTLLFMDFLKLAAIICIFIFLNSFIRLYKRIIPGIPIEFEICILGTVTITIAYGIWAGIILALLSSIVAEFINQFISPFSLVNIGAYFLVPFMAFFLSPASVAIGGFVIVIIANVIIFFVSLLLGYDHFKNTAYSVTNIFFNYFLFSYLAVPLLRIMI
jgi:hypothetical protein